MFMFVVFKYSGVQQPIWEENYRGNRNDSLAHIHLNGECTTVSLFKYLNSIDYFVFWGVRYQFLMILPPQNNQIDLRYWQNYMTVS